MAELICHFLLGLLRAPRRTVRIWKAVSAYSGKEKLLQLIQTMPFVAEKPDCLHFEWNFAATSYMDLFDLLQCPSVVSCRGTQVMVAPHNPARKEESSLIRHSFEKASAIHCVSEAVARAAIECGAAPAKIHVFRPAVDPELFRPVERPERADGSFHILMTCTIGWVKGYEYALAALRTLRDSGVDARLTIAGGADKTNRQRLLYTIHDLGLTDCVRLPGRLASGAVLRELQGADAYLLSSVSEGISNSALEAMSCGICVVSSMCPGMEEVITDGVDGFLVPVRQPRIMAERLAELARSPELRQAMGRAARQRILREFSHDRLLAEWSGLYRSLCGTGCADGLR